MSEINIYKKIQILLFISIVLAFILLIKTAIKSNKEENYLAEATFSEMTDLAEENKENGENAGEVLENEGDTSWDEEAEDTQVDEEEKEEEKEENTYYIKINYTANCITIYKKDSAGEYTVPVKALVCSTGTATPKSGVYKMGEKYRWHQLNGGVYGQYCSRITGHILFHSVPYSKNSPDSLKYVAYDKLGTKASAGCIRLTTEDAMWIYNNCPSGTLVEFYSSSNPGPLGKPSAQKISSNVECRNWDPTDPTKGNPWHTYTPKQEENTAQPEVNVPVYEEPAPAEPVPEVPSVVEPENPPVSDESVNNEVNQNTSNDNTSGESVDSNVTYDNSTENNNTENNDTNSSNTSANITENQNNSEIENEI